MLLCVKIILIYAVWSINLDCIDVNYMKKMIIVHGMQMFHVALIYTCNMKENAWA